MALRWCERFPVCFLCYHLVWDSFGSCLIRSGKRGTTKSADPWWCRPLLEQSRELPPLHLINHQPDLPHPGSRRVSHLRYRSSSSVVILVLVLVLVLVLEFAPVIAIFAKPAE